MMRGGKGREKRKEEENVEIEKGWRAEYVVGVISILVFWELRRRLHRIFFFLDTIVICVREEENSKKKKSFRILVNLELLH